MRWDTPKQRLIRAAQAVVTAYRAGEGVSVMAQLIVDLEEAIEGTRPVTMAAHAKETDPEFFAKVGALGGRGGSGESKARPSDVAARGGAASRGVKKPHRKPTGPWICPCGQRVRSIAGAGAQRFEAKRIGGFVRNRPVSWAECPGCHQPVGPFVYDEDLEV
jgi:hypothetical protein